MPISAFKLITPTSIVVAGGTASVGQFGKVSFSAATSLSLNGVFSSTYDNYMVAIRSIHSANQRAILCQLRSAGTNATGANYTYQYLEGTGGSVLAARTSSATSFVFGATSETQRSGDTTFVFGPFLAQPTAVRTINVNGNGSADLFDFASTHSLSTSYDGFTLSVSSGSFSGEIAVYGCNQ